MRTLKRLVQTLIIAPLLLLLVACAMHLSNSGESVLSSKADGLLRMATYNVHYIRLGRENGAWSVGDWQRRKAPMSMAVRTVDADIFAFQEMESFAGGDEGSVNLTLDYLLQQHPEFAAAAVGDWRIFPSTQAIFYRKDRLRLLDQGWFFFSDTPDVIYSRTFNGSYPAFCSWAKLRTASGENIFVFNVHFEFKSSSNRLLSAELLKSRVSPLIDAGERVLIVGDINERAGGKSLKILESVGIKFLAIDGSTYHLNRGINLFSAIDHIGASANIYAKGVPTVLRRKFLGEWPSDHYPAYADFDLSSPEQNAENNPEI